MSSARKPSSFLKMHYDKLLLVATLAALLISAVMLLLQFKGGASALTIRPGQLEAAAPKSVETLDTEALTALSEAIAGPFQVANPQRRLLVGDLRVSSVPDGLPIPFDAVVCPFTGAAQPDAQSITERDDDGDGLPNVWEEQFGFNPFNPADGLTDSDGDGFTNLEEFLAGTDPTDAALFPPPSAKLRLVRVIVNPFKLRFLGVSTLPNGDTAYQLNARTLDRTYFPRMNEEVEGYTVTGYDADGPMGPVLTLVQGEKTIQLVQGQVINDQALTALMVFLVDGTRHRVIIGDSLELLDNTYKVVDIASDRVVIRDESSAQEIEVGMISDEERRGLSGGNRSEAVMP